MAVFGVAYQNNLVKSVIEEPGVRRLAKMPVGIGPDTGPDTDKKKSICYYNRKREIYPVK